MKNPNNFYWVNRVKEINKRSKKGDLTGKKLMELYEKNPYCHYCKIPLDKKEAIIEHKTPISRGGGNFTENVCIACDDCNRFKGTKTEEEFKKFIADYLNRFTKRS